MFHTVQLTYFKTYLHVSKDVQGIWQVEVYGPYIGHSWPHILIVPHFIMARSWLNQHC